jgi:hypothetical protein
MLILYFTYTTTHYSTVPRAEPFRTRKPFEEHSARSLSNPPSPSSRCSARRSRSGLFFDKETTRTKDGFAGRESSASSLRGRALGR